MIVVGWLLVSGLVVSALGSGVAYRGGGFTGRFWALPLDEKLTHIHTHRSQWWWLSIGAIVGLAVMTAGVFGLTVLLDAEGQRPLAWVAVGVYLVALIAWMVGLLVQTATLPTAATEQAESGVLPPWIQGFWAVGYLAEAIWVIIGNLAYAVVGMAILRSGLVSDWAGWVAVAAGLLIPIVVVVTRYGFPELVQIVPFVVGIALLLGG